MAIPVEVLLINDEYWKAYTPINGAVDSALMTPYIILAQDKYLERYLGTDLYVKIKADTADASIAGNYLTLRDTYIMRVVLWWTVTEALPNLRIKIDNGTIAIRTSEDTQTIGANELNSLIDKCRDNAQLYTQKMVDYLCYNSSLFPEYSTNTNNDKSPSTDVYGKTGTVSFSAGNSRYSRPPGYCQPYSWRCDN